MIISKKKFDEAIRQAKNETYAEMEKRECARDQERFISGRFDDVYNRLNKAFVDIDRRLSALEAHGGNDGPVCMKY